MGFKNRFWNKVKKGKQNECWIWLGATTKKGYGRFKINNQLYGANRISYILNYGKFDKKLFVCHTCDNPFCVNPKHLFLGTRSDNMKDAYKKGRLNILKGKRFKRGDNNPFRKITDKQSLEIKNSKEKVSRLARRFKVSKSLIYKIKSGLRRNYPTQSKDDITKVEQKEGSKIPSEPIKEKK